MALLKTIPHPTGTDAEYWRISRAEINSTGKTLFVELSGYVSEQARRDGKEPLFTNYIRVRGSAYEAALARIVMPLEEEDLSFGHALYRELYCIVKECEVPGSEQFEGAEDV